MFDYYIGLAKRKVSFAVRLIDSFTGNPVDGYALVKNCVPVIKPDKFHVFTGIKRGDLEITVGGKCFFEDVINIKEDDRIWESDNKELDVYLVPGSGYEIPPGSFYVKFRFDKQKSSRKFFIIQKTNIGSLIELGDSEIYLNSPEHFMADNGHFTFMNENEPDVFVIGYHIALNKYKLKIPPRKKHKTGEKIYPVNIGKTDEDGELICPVKKFNSKSSESEIYTIKGEYLTTVSALCASSESGSRYI